jgi:hypothetical protein
MCSDEGKTQYNNRVHFIRDKDDNPSLAIYCMGLQHQAFWKIGSPAAKVEILDFLRVLADSSGSEEVWLCSGGDIVEWVRAGVREIQIMPPRASSKKIEPPGVFDDTPMAQCETTPFEEKHRWR